MRVATLPGTASPKPRGMYKLLSNCSLHSGKLNEVKTKARSCLCSVCVSRLGLGAGGRTVTGAPGNTAAAAPLLLPQRPLISLPVLLP